MITTIQKAHRLAKLIWQHQEPLAGTVLRLHQKEKLGEVEERELERISLGLLNLFKGFDT